MILITSLQTVRKKKVADWHVCYVVSGWHGWGREPTGFACVVTTPTPFHGFPLLFSMSD